MYKRQVQGCTYKDLRQEAAKYVADKGADGNAIGGLAVGEPTEVMYEMIEVVNEILPKDKPRYLMGVGTPTNIPVSYTHLDVYKRQA